MNILVVDDEKEIADVIALYLQSDQYTVYPFYTGEEALECMKTTKIDLAILDVMLPGIDGFEILKKIRERYTFPVIMLTAKTEYIDKITGLTLGADDYILKPFNPLELIARVKAQLRRYTQYNEGTRTDSGDIIDFAGLQLNRESHECVYNEKQLTLTPIELIFCGCCVRTVERLSARKNCLKMYGKKSITKIVTIQSWYIFGICVRR